MRACVLVCNYAYVRVCMYVYMGMYICMYVCMYVCICVYMFMYVYVYIQGVTGGTDQTSGECSLGQTIPI